ncbi:MAG: hypothetical protein HY075_14885, partial [Deltaproteobacteria bacterium]|nr:hypothetical protein [Deltaproteobacteria bacterium]
LQLGWQHVTIPAHEILDAHHLTRALSDLSRFTPGVVVLDNVEQIFKRIDSNDVFDILDFAAERLDGMFWVATSRKPEEVPKNQLVRPGRFEELVRLSAPGNEVKKKYYELYLEPFMVAANGGQADLFTAAKQEHLAALEQNENLTYSHLQEMRLLVAKVLMDGGPDRLVSEFQMFCQEQLIAGDRWGGPSSQTNELEERIKLSDPRLLLSALHVTDAFKKIVEATISSASEALAAAQAEQQG